MHITFSKRLISIRYPICWEDGPIGARERTHQGAIHRVPRDICSFYGGIRPCQAARTCEIKKDTR